jgi:hypothetical protein
MVIGLDELDRFKNLVEAEQFDKAVEEIRYRLWLLEKKSKNTSPSDSERRIMVDLEKVVVQVAEHRKAPALVHLQKARKVLISNTKES